MPSLRTPSGRDDAPDPRAEAALESLRASRDASPRSLLESLTAAFASARGALRTRSADVRWWLLGVGAVALLAVIAAVVVVRTSATANPASDLPMAATTSIPMVTPSTAPGAAIVVHAAGAVRQPGVYRMPAGSRVVDLLDRAGGPAADIDLDRVNLAAALTDGERVFLPRVGESAPVAAGGDGAAAAGGPGSTSPVDLNQATVAQLDALPGIGPTTAAAIVAHRQQKGPFRSVDDLLSVRGIGAAKLDALREFVTVG
jgi:competence protein ComEA